MFSVLEIATKLFEVVTICDHIFFFLGSQLIHEIRWRSFVIAFDRLVERFLWAPRSVRPNRHRSSPFVRERSGCESRCAPLAAVFLSQRSFGSGDPFDDFSILATIMAMIGTGCPKLAIPTKMDAMILNEDDYCAILGKSGARMEMPGCTLMGNIPTVAEFRDVAATVTV
jgi:hypothetical protein